jgi:DNA-binding winged helix-turn-helix (wHTH) protein
MTRTVSEPRTQRFGEFVVDCYAGELYRRGRKIKVQLQPMQVLVALLEKPGDVVTREQLREKIWPANTFVDFEHSLNTAIKKLRQALGDKANRSKFVETLPRRGYRFLPEVESSEKKPLVKVAASSRLEGKVFRLVAEPGNECVLAPADGKALDEWRRLIALGDDVGIAMMITDKRLLLLAVEQTVRLLSVDGATGWCEARVLEGEHYGKTALLGKASLASVATIIGPTKPGPLKKGRLKKSKA